MEVITDIHMTSYTDYSLNTLDESYCYKIIASDVCGQSNDLDQASQHCTVNITAETISNNSVSVTWTPYVGCDVVQYHVLRKEDGNNDFHELSVVDSDVLSYVDNTV